MPVKPKIAAGLVAGVVDPGSGSLRFGGGAGVTDPGYNCEESEVSSPLVDGENGNFPAPIILNRQNATRERRLPLARCFR